VMVPRPLMLLPEAPPPKVRLASVCAVVPLVAPRISKLPLVERLSALVAETAPVPVLSRMSKPSYAKMPPVKPELLLPESTQVPASSLRIASRCPTPLSVMDPESVFKAVLTPPKANP